MKTAFKIKHDESSVSEDMHVLIEVAGYGASIVWFRKDPLSIEAVSTYNFSDDITPGSLIENLQKIIESNGLKESVSVNVFYNFQESILIPSEFFSEDSTAAQLNLIYGVSPGSVLAHDVMNPNDRQEKMYCVYRIPAGIHEMLGNIASVIPRHSTSLLVKSPGTNVLQCTIFHNTIKIVLYKHGQLQIVQQFGYKTPADVVYHLLNTCHKHDVSATEVNLYIDGMIDSDSSLYQEIYKYFLNLQFNTIADDIVVSESIKEHPLHFISHLTELARCV